jgi:hypothetical protein
MVKVKDKLDAIPLNKGTLHSHVQTAGAPSLNQCPGSGAMLPG